MEIANKLARLSILRTACLRDLPAGDRVTLARTLHYRDKATSFCMRGENYASAPPPPCLTKCMLGGEAFSLGIPWLSAQCVSSFLRPCTPFERQTVLTASQ